ncbi:marine proteobacterial sortase target protein [uncultured Sphingomonas sp.]|uniref:marine proteobacterial sortase target protein n=1 Tax=uncultured Sphingomonas sp. TaxID=158754 RepID=UPI0025DA6134|nr:marine proteobacterial sortase target protein [uncultured Sphingomonas sp.]
MQLRTIPNRPSAADARYRQALGAIGLVGMVLGSLLATQARAAENDDPAAGGALLLQARGGKDGAPAALPAVRLGTDIDVVVNGPVMRVRMTQAFRNTSRGWMEATYLYPLPEDGAVDTLKMVVGQRVIIGHIKRRAEARDIYERAKAQGQRSGLVEADRPNLFRTNVANVGPGETVLIAIEYQAPVRQLGGEYALRLPLVVGPRYVPPRNLTSSAGVADAARVTAPLAAPGAPLNPVSITVHLAPGFTPANILSPYHRISVVDAGPSERTITLAKGEEPADRDFELRWRSASADPMLGLFRQTLGGQHYVMATITPQTHVEPGKVAPREMIFVIDNSGSMSGSSMDAAKQSLLHALGTLRPEDTFNVIRFDNTMTQLFDHPIHANAEQVALARTFTTGLQAAGGTEMLPALKAALADAHPADSGVRQIVFLTDGDLSDEKEMMAEIAAHGGRSRVFMVGIGSAPNNYLMRRMAEAGRGTYTNIGEGGEVLAKMTALLDRLKAPAMHDIAVRVEGSPLDLTPHDLPDLYAGEPLVLLGKGDALKGVLVVSGRVGDTRWSQRIDLSQAADSPAVARLWASRSIADVEAQRWSGQLDGAAADEKVAQLGLAYDLVTTQTSLVAVDETPARPEGARLTSEDLPLLLPKGWDFNALLGQDAPAPATAAGLPEPEQQMDLPQTATGYLGAMWQGLAMLALGMPGLVAAHRPRRAEARK